MQCRFSSSYPDTTISRAGGPGELMLLLECITGRNLSPDYLQHVKVVYREIFEDHLRFNNRQARTIVRCLLSKDIPYFEQIKESIFLREKISRGLFRELGYLDEYHLKNEIQRKYYDLVLSCFCCYDELRIADDLTHLFVKMAELISNALNN